MTGEILELMDERRQHKATNKSEYKKIQKTIRSKIRKAKNVWFEEQCKEIEVFDQPHDSFHVYKKVKELAGEKRISDMYFIEDKDGNLLKEPEDKL